MLDVEINLTFIYTKHNSSTYCNYYSSDNRQHVWAVAVNNFNLIVLEKNCLPDAEHIVKKWVKNRRKINKVWTTYSACRLVHENFNWLFDVRIKIKMFLPYKRRITDEIPKWKFLYFLIERFFVVVTSMVVYVAIPLSSLHYSTRILFETIQVFFQDKVDNSPKKVFRSIL